MWCVCYRLMERITQQHRLKLFEKYRFSDDVVSTFVPREVKILIAHIVHYLELDEIEAEYSMAENFKDRFLTQRSYCGTISNLRLKVKRLKKENDELTDVKEDRRLVDYVTCRAPHPVWRLGHYQFGINMPS